MFAPVGTKLGELEIGAREIRGVRSEGMICSERELDIGPDHEGILVLPDDTRAGTRLAELAPGLIDTIYELSITPNRPDALGHVGVARDLAVKLHAETSIDPRILPDAPVLGDLVALQAPQRCGRYIGRAFTAAKVGASPLWLRVRLHRLGLRPINSVVDLNPRKHGSFVPGSGTPVVAPEALVEFSPDVVVLANPIYRDEVRSILADLGQDVDVICV